VGFSRGEALCLTVSHAENGSLLKAVNLSIHPEDEFVRLLEKTFAWLSQARRLAKDCERLPETRVAIIHRAMSRIMLRRILTRPVH